MKILIIGFTHPNYMPYLHHYLRLLDNSSEHDVSVAYWNRSNLNNSGINITGHTYIFNKSMSDTDNLLKKIPKILKYSSFLKKVLKRNDFDLLIVLHTTTAFVIKSMLYTKYKNKFIFDYRDVTYENLNFYRKEVHKIIKHSALCISSSKGFDRYFPIEKEVYYLHNINPAKKNDTFKINDKIIIRFWGFIRHPKINELIIEAISKDDRFELHYHGKIQEIVKRLIKFSKLLDSKNVFFHGEYNNNDRIAFASNTNLIHNIYENDYVTSYAMGNKYYDGLQFKIPQICSEGSFMGSEVNSYHVGLTVDVNKSGFLDTIYEYYLNLNFEAFKENCTLALNECLNENNETDKHIIKVIKEIKHV